jgi:predicted nucleotidyltransferase
MLGVERAYATERIRKDLQMRRKHASSKWSGAYGPEERRNLMCPQVNLDAMMKTVYDKSIAEFGDNLDAVILYGSYARGDYDDESDIDVMIRVRMDKQELAKHRWDMSGLASDLSLEHNVTLSLHLQDDATLERYKNVVPYYLNVLREGVRIGA